MSVYTWPVHGGSSSAYRLSSRLSLALRLRAASSAFHSACSCSSSPRSPAKYVLDVRTPSCLCNKQQHTTCLVRSVHVHLCMQQERYCSALNNRAVARAICTHNSAPTGYMCVHSNAYMYCSGATSVQLACSRLYMGECTHHIAEEQCTYTHISVL
jgi:hypothetical protein